MDTDESHEEKIHELLTRGVVEVIGKETLETKLRNRTPLRVKLGIDPTSPHLHLGRSIPLLKLRDFQELGHTVVFIVGDFTGVIGDTSDKESERPMLTEAVIATNKAHYLEQVGKIIDLSKAEFRHNSEWLGGLGYGEIGLHADQFSVADFIARENIKKRLDQGKRVSLREVLYPLMQGYDSVAVQADVELGGTDQRFNLLAGRTLQEGLGQAPQSVVMGPLILGLDGRKMSSSWGNTINLDDEPNDMYGKVMSVRDELVATYFELCTRVPRSEVETLVRTVQSGTMHPRDAKMRLAREIVTMYHSVEEARGAEAAFVDVFQNKNPPEDAEEVKAQAGELLMDVFVRAGIVSSKTEFRRLIDQGAITSVDTGGARITTHDALAANTVLYKVGKRRFVRVV